MKEEGCRGRDKRKNVEKVTEAPVKSNDKDKQGLFVEFIQFLIKIGMFNKNIVNSLLSNKEIFM